MKKRVIAAFLSALMIAATACGQGQTESTGDSDGDVSASTTSSAASVSDSDGRYHIGIIAERDLTPMTQTVEGLRSQLQSEYGDNIRFDYVCADGSDDKYNEALTRFTGNGDDVIVAVGEEALTHAAAATSSIPIVGTCVTDYLSTGLINSEDEPGGNITGVTDLPPIEEQAAMITNYFVSGGHISDDYVGGYSGSDAETSDTDSSDVTASLDVASSGNVSSSDTLSDTYSGSTSDQVGVFYTSDDKGSEFTARVMDKYLTADSVSWKNYEVKDEDDLESQIREACEDCSVIYLPANVFFAENMSAIRQITLEEKVPVITAESSMCAAGGLATYSIDYTQEGEKAAEMVSDILERKEKENGESSSGGASTEESEEESKKGNPEKMEIQNVKDTASYYYNPVTAGELDWYVRGSFSALTDTHDDADTQQTANPGTGTRTYSDQ